MKISLSSLFNEKIISSILHIIFLAVFSLIKENSLPLKIEETRKKQAKGSLLQQWVVIRNLMECAVDWRLTDDNNNLMYNKTDVARFLSFICGGSEDRIRKRLDEEISSKEMNEIIPYLESIGLHKIAERLKK